MSRSWERAFVVGGSEGIGLAVAQRLAADGVDVAVFGRSEDKLGAARETLGGTAYAASLDVTDAAGTAEVLDRAVAEVGVPDLVVSAASVTSSEAA